MIAQTQTNLAAQDVDLAVKYILDQLSEALAHGERVEIRGFGSFSLHHREGRAGRNPKTGTSVNVGERYTPRFRPGKLLRDRINASVVSE
jgi:integration host factor subunit beta